MFCLVTITRQGQISSTQSLFLHKILPMHATLERIFFATFISTCQVVEIGKWQKAVIVIRWASHVLRRGARQAKNVHIHIQQNQPQTPNWYCYETLETFC